MNDKKSELAKAKFYHARIKATKGCREEMRYWANKINRLQKQVGL
jgi:hypothetical protein